MSDTAQIKFDTPADLAPAFNYSDGDEAENYLLKVVSEASDLSSGSRELADPIRDWPSEYHLSPVRANLLRGFNFPKGARAIEIGAGCGAISRFLGEAGLKVTSVEGSPRRSKIAAQRCRDLKNVEVVTANVIDFQPEEKADLVFLLGVLEYAPMFVPGDDPVQRLLEICDSFLKPDGTLVVAIENRLGLKYLNGAPEDHVGVPFWGIEDLYTPKSMVTFGRQELVTRLASAGFPDAECYYPFPDYKLPEVIISQRALESETFQAGELLHQMYSGGNGRSFSASFDEPLAWSTLGRNKLIADLANSFLIFAGKKPSRSADWIAKFFGRGSETSFVESDGGEITVTKVFSVKADNVLFRREREPARYVVGSQYHNDLRRVLFRRGKFNEAAEWARPWVQLLTDAASGNSTAALLPKDFVDCVPYNLVITPNGELEYIDREWVGTDAPTLGWVVIRGLVHSIWRCGWKGELAGFSYQHAVKEIAKLLEISLTEDDFKHAAAREEELVLTATGAASAENFSEVLRRRIENTVQFWWHEAAEHTELLSRAKAEIDVRDSRVLDLEALLTEARAERRSVQLTNESLRQLAFSRQELFEREAALRAKEQEQAKVALEEQIAERDALAAKLQQAEATLHQILSSKSWALTAPIRQLAQKLKNL